MGRRLRRLHASTHGRLPRALVALGAGENDVPMLQLLAQLSYNSAKHLGDTGLRAMQVRGRVQEGCVADITIFDPQTVTDHATYKGGEGGLPSTGIPYVLVNGTVVVKDSKVLEVYPGQPIRFPVEDQGRFKALDEKVWRAQFQVEGEYLRINGADSRIGQSSPGREHRRGAEAKSRLALTRQLRRRPGDSARRWSIYEPWHMHGFGCDCVPQR